MVMGSALTGTASMRIATENGMKNVFRKMTMAAYVGADPPILQVVHSTSAMTVPISVVLHFARISSNQPNQS
jgi:hypothetical protein